jgi:hypothetical protein
VHVEGWNNQGLSTGNQTYGPLCYDNVAPTISQFVNPSVPSSGWYKQNVSVTASATDPGGSNASGVTHIYYGINNPYCQTQDYGYCNVYSGPLTVSQNGVNTVTVFSMDKAGNFSNVVTDTIKVDESTPVTTLGLSGALVNNSFVTAVTIVLTARENYSGVAATHYSLNGGATQTYNGSFTVSTPGAYTIKYWSVSVAGDTETASTSTFTITSPTTLTMTPSANPTVAGQTLTLTATITATLGGTPTGTVTFYRGTTSLGSTTLSGGVSKLNISTLPVGSDGLFATYNGATYYAGSTSTPFYENVLEATATTVTSSNLSVNYGTSVTLTATVKASSGTPAGTVQFFDGSTSIGSTTLNSSGAGSIKISTLPVGKDSITAVYAGNSTFKTSTSAVIVQTIKAITGPTP